MLTYLFDIFKRKEPQLSTGASCFIRVPDTVEFNIAELAAKFDDIATKELHEKLKYDLGTVPKILAKLNLSGRWGFLLLSALTILPTLAQKIINSSTVTFTADSVDPSFTSLTNLTISLLQNIFSLPNIINLAPGLLAAIGLYSTHNSAVALKKLSSGDLRITANAQLAGLLVTAMAVKMREKDDVEDCSAEKKAEHKMGLRRRRGSVS